MHRGAVGFGARLGCQLAAFVGRVVTGDIAEADLEQQVVPTVHLLARPTQRIGRLLRVRDRFRQQVRRTVVLPHLDLLGVDQDQAHLIRRGAHQQRRDDAVKTTGLARTGGARDQQVRHRGQVEEHSPTGDVFTDGHVERVRGGLRLGGIHDVAQTDQLTRVVRYLDTDRRTTGDGGQNAHIDRSHRIRDVASEAGDPRHLDALPQLEFVARDGGADRLAHQLGLDTMRHQRIDQRATAGLHLGLVDHLVRAALQVAHRWQLPLTTLRAGTQFQFVLLARAGVHRDLTWCTFGLAGLLRLRRRIPVVLGLTVVQRRPGKPTGIGVGTLAIALQRRHLIHRRADLATERTEQRVHAVPGTSCHRAQRVASDEHHADDE
ncbi:unannotated protein [freshwater metagenome]|uniref:Unannotated protein n=1 Tax=freshwater metagenome TaxID=449393 RepID=A0A6J7PJ41_9ZZZZ